METTADIEKKLDTELEKTLATLTLVEDDDQSTENTTANTTTATASAAELDTGDNDDNELIDVDPVVDPWPIDDTSDRNDIFTDGELINVLRSFDPEYDPEDNQDNLEDTLFEFPAGEALPELDFEQGDESLLLAPADFTASIFDPTPLRETTDSNQELAFLEQTDPLLTNPFIDDLETFGTIPLHGGDGNDGGNDGKKGDLDDELALLEGLQKLNLAWPSSTAEDDDDEEDDLFLPAYMYCQPCTPDETTLAALASIEEDQELLDLDPSATLTLRQLQLLRPKLPEKEFDTLLELSLLSVEDGGENPYLSEAEMDALFHAGNNDAAANANVDADVAQDDQLVGGEQHSHEQHHLPEDHHQHQQPPTLEDQQQPFIVSNRSEAFDCAAGILSSFVPKKSGVLANERCCIGHKETIFGAGFSECGKYLATASQDSTVRIWNTKTNAALSTLSEHSTKHECLRVSWASSNWAKDILDRGTGSDFSSLIATAGADGAVKVWTSKDPSKANAWGCCATLDHSDFERLTSNPEDEAEQPQVYAIQWIDHWSGLPSSSDNAAAQNSFLLTSSDDFIHLWELESKSEDDPKQMKFREVMSLNFVAFQNPGYGVSICQVTNSGLDLQSSGGQVKKCNDASHTQKAFGGDRNPNNMIFVFDAAYCSQNGLLGVALSDGSLRLVNGRGICISVMQLPGCQSHLTSFSWDSTGTRLATSVATGHVILWGVDVHEDKGSLVTTCTAILEGGHQPGRPVFGSKYIANGENLLLTWGVDGCLCLWDSFSQGNISAPIATLVANKDYPIYAVDAQASHIAVGGGGGGDETSFLGVPMMLYDTETMGITVVNDSQKE